METLRSFFPWCGGKHHVRQEIVKYIPNQFDTYYEPFLGGGSIFLTLAPKKAVVNDMNHWLIILFCVVEQQLPSLLRKLSAMQKQETTREMFLSELDKFNAFQRLDRERWTETQLVTNAARFYFLLKKCYGGQMWYQDDDSLKVKYCKALSEQPLYNKERLQSVSKYLQSADVKYLTGDYREAIKSAKKGDFVYLDPPYYQPDRLDRKVGKYNKEEFTEEHHWDLYDVFVDLDKRGCYVMLSNAYNKDIVKLFSKYTIHKFKGQRSFKKCHTDESRFNELLIMNY